MNKRISYYKYIKSSVFLSKIVPNVILPIFYNDNIKNSQPQKFLAEIFRLFIFSHTVQIHSTGWEILDWFERELGSLDIFLALVILISVEN